MTDTTSEAENERYLGAVFRKPSRSRRLRWRLRWLVFVAVFIQLYILGVALLGNVLADRHGLHLGPALWLAAVPGWFLFMALVLAVYRIGPARRRWELARQALRSADSVASIRLAEGVMGRRLARMPDRDAMVLHNRARMQILFGEVAAARHSLSLVDWEARAPVIHALGVADEAALELLCFGNAREGLALARRSLELGRVRKSPNRIRSRRHWRVALLGLGEVLAGEATGKILARLRKLARRANDLAARVLATRALYVAAWRAGDMKQADDLRHRLEDDAPHCDPVLAPPDGPPTGATWSRNPGEPSRARLPNAWAGPRGRRPAAEKEEHPA